MRTAKGASAGLVLLDGLLLATFAGVMLRIGGARLDAAALLWLFFGGAIVVTSGVVVVSLALGPDTAASNSLAVLLGSVATSLFLLAGCYVTGTHAGTIFLCWSVLVVVAAASRRALLARQLASVDRVEI